METVTMSYEELDRVSVIERVIEKRLVDKHHKGMASASNSVSPRDYAGWCLPASSDILELEGQRSPTRGGTDGKVHRD
jgi:hypothetical protein